MLALFKETQVAPIVTPVIPWARAQWRRALDKGRVPLLHELHQSWSLEFPEAQPHELEAWVATIQPNWVLQSVSADTREVFCHHPALIEAVGNIRTRLTCPLQDEDWELWVETFAATVGLEFNYTHPCGSAHWKHGETEWRVTLLHGSVAPHGRPKVFIRQLAAVAHALKDFGLDAAGTKLLVDLVTRKENLLVAGATSSGKTSLLSSLLAQLDDDDHVVLLEDTQEITCHASRLTRMLSTRQIGRSLNDYLAHALRLSPDRIILGEMRSHEVVPYLLAMNTGHRGLMSTLHASSAVDALLRVAQLFVLASGQKDISYQEVLRLVSRNVGYVVFVEQRKIQQIIKVYGHDGEQPLYDVIWATPLKE
jgi:Flp pilus assembly CpaF family ATPase